MSANLSPDHARVVEEFQRSLSDTIAPFREEVRIGLAVQSERLQHLAERIGDNEETTLRVGLKVDEIAERTATLEGEGEGKGSTQAGFFAAATAALTAIGAYVGGYLDP